jgi:putative transposase
MTAQNISHPDKLRNFWDAVILRSEEELTMEEYRPLLSLLDIDFTNFLTLSKAQKWYKIKKYAIVEFLPRNRLRTLITKLNSADKDSQITKLLQILVPLLIGIEKDLRPFWTESIRDLSNKLWLPTKTDCPDLDMNSSSISFRNIKSNSWFSIKKSQANLTSSQMTSSQLLQSSQLDIMANESIKLPKITVLRSRKIRLHLTSDQKQIFNRWMGTSRYLYNKTIEYINSDQPYLGKGKLRTKFVTNVTEDLLWQKEIPQGVREGAVFYAYNAFDSNMKKFKKTRIPFTLRFRTRKARSQTINLPVDSLKENFRLYPRLLGKNSAILTYEHEKSNIQFRTKTINEMVDKLDENGKVIKNQNGKKIKVKSGRKINCGQILKNELKIQKLKTGEWYLLVPLEINVKNSDNQGGIISLDPGVRTFQTGYSPDGSVFQFGDGDIKNIRNYMLKTDKFQSILSGIKGRKRHRYRKAFLKRLRNVKNRIKDCHRKVVKYLVDNFDIIIVPIFHSKDMCNRDRRRINSVTVRNMMGWSHYKFRMMLISKVLEYSKKRVLFPSEEYTSKTCTRCGVIKNNLGSSKVLMCSSCGLVIDRDVNGSRNILLKTCNELSEVITSTCLTLGPLLGDQ